MILRIKADRGNSIIIRWSGFVVDGCHEGNKIRIVDGDQQESGLFLSQVLTLRRPTCQSWHIRVFFSSHG